MTQERELELVDAIYDAFDEGDPERALRLARDALSGAEVEDPVLRYLAGRGLLELDRPEEAAQELGRAASLDAEDPEFRTYLAWALFRACRFDDANREIERALASGEALPETHYVQALCLERSRRFEAAERGFARAARLDPQRFPAPLRFDDAEFRVQLERARAGLREDFRGHLDRVAVLVDDLPPEAVLLEEQPPLDPEQLLGLFSGVPLDQQSTFSTGGEMPPRIHLFKRNLERFVEDGEELAEQIRVTLYHELGHYLGLDEDALEDLGYG